MENRKAYTSLTKQEWTMAIVKKIFITIALYSVIFLLSFFLFKQIGVLPPNNIAEQKQAASEYAKANNYKINYNNSDLEIVVEFLGNDDQIIEKKLLKDF